MKNYKAYIFDFDGTIADTYETTVELLGEASNKFGYKVVTEEDIKRYRTMNAKAILKDIGVPIWKFWRMKKIHEWGRTRIGEFMPKIEMFPGLIPVFEKLSSNSIKLYILTSNSQENVEVVLRNHGAEAYFTDISAKSSLLGKHRKIKNFIKKKGLKKEEVLYVGDEVRDVEACKKIGVDIAAVSWGFSSVEGLKDAGADYLIDKPEELVSLF